MADTKPTRASIGFQGGQALAIRALPEALDTLRTQLQAEGPRGWHELQSADGAVLVDLAQVVYVRTESDEQRVGF